MREALTRLREAEEANEQQLRALKKNCSRKKRSSNKHCKSDQPL